eukprot:UN00650
MAKPTFVYALVCLVLISLLVKTTEAQANAACGVCCGLYWTCMATRVFTLFMGTPCSTTYRYCLSTCECFKFA